MLTIEVSRKIDPVDEVFKYLGASGVSMKMNEQSVQIDGNLDKSFFKNICNLDIVKITNEKKKQEKEKEKLQPIFENGHVTYIASNFQPHANVDSIHKIKRGQVWKVDLGQPVGEELGYKRPAVVLGKSSTNNTFMVIPFTSQAKYGRVYQVKFNKDTLKDANEEFLNSSWKVSYALFDNQDSFDRCRFIEYCGMLDESIFNELLKESKIIMPEAEIKRSVSIEDLMLTEKQSKMLEILNRNSDLLGIANNTSFTYENRVHGLLSVFGFKVELGGDVDYLVDLIKNTKCQNHIDIKHENEQIAKFKANTILTAQAINTKLVELTKKRFKDLHPCLLEFVTLINKLAA